MEPRFNLFETEFGSKFAKKFANLGMALQQSTLPGTLGELVSLRASQINGCGWCVDIHTKEAAAAGGERRAAESRRHLARVDGIHRGRAGRIGAR